MTGCVWWWFSSEPPNGCLLFLFFFFNDTSTTEIYTLSLHDALPISSCAAPATCRRARAHCRSCRRRSEEHTSELQSRGQLVCRLLLEKKNLARHGPGVGSENRTRGIK